MNTSNNENINIENVISLGADIAGNVISTSIGFLLAGPPGALIAAASGPVLSEAIKNGCLEIKDRYLAPREKIRIGAAAAFAISEIKSNLEGGKKIRNDDFFKKDFSNRSKAEEIFEGVLIKSKNDHEEKKIKYYGNLFANIAFYQHIDIGTANSFLTIAERLTYQQIVLLTIFGRKLNSNLRQKNYIGEDIPANLMPLINETLQLCQLNLVYSKNNVAILAMGNIMPAYLELSLLGNNLYKLMDLAQVPLEDIEHVAALFK